MNPNAPTSPWPGYDDHAAPSRKASSGGLPAMFAGAAILAVGCGGGFAAGWVTALVQRNGNPFAAGFNPGSYTPPPLTTDATVTIEHPDTLTVGEPFDLTITITDTRDEQRYLSTVSLRGAIADQFEYVEFQPKAQGHSFNYGYRSYTTEEAIDPLGATTITITLKPKTAGEHTGTIDVYLDDYDSVATPVTFTVGE